MAGSDRYRDGYFENREQLGHFFQKLFQNGICEATAETVIVQVRNDKSGSQPLSEEAKGILGGYMLSSPPDAIRQ